MPGLDAITQTYRDVLKAALAGGSSLPLTGPVGDDLLAAVREECADFLAVDVAASTADAQLAGWSRRSMPPPTRLAFEGLSAKHLHGGGIHGLHDTVKEVVSNYLNRFIVETVYELAEEGAVVASDGLHTLAVKMVDGHYAHSLDGVRLCLAPDVHRAYGRGRLRDTPHFALERANASGVVVRSSALLDPGAGLAVRASPRRPPGMWVRFPESLPMTRSREGGSLVLTVGGHGKGCVLPRHPGMYTKFTIATDAGE